MNSIALIRSRAYHLPSPDIDTDQVFPSRFTNRVDGRTDLSDIFFHDQRFDGEGRPIPGAVLNDPALKGAAIIVAGPNYACGSARPGAIFSHVDFGIRVLVSESFGPVFPTVCFKFGLIPIELPKEEVARLAGALAARATLELEVDLEAREIRLPGDAPIPIRLDEYVRLIALSGRTEISVTQGYSDEIEAFEQRRRSSVPWLFG